MNEQVKAFKKIQRLPWRFAPIMVMTYFSINVLNLALPITMKKIYGDVILSGSKATLSFILLFAMIALFLESLMRYIKETSLKWIGSRYEYRMTNLLLERLLSGYQEQKVTYITNLEKFNTIKTIAAYQSTAFYQLFIDVPFAFLFLYLIFLYGQMLVMIPVAVSAMYLFLILLVSNRYFKNRLSYDMIHEDHLAQMIETLENIHFVKGTGTETSQIIKFKKLMDQVSIHEYEGNRNDMLPDLLGTRLSQISMFLILLYGGYLLSLNQLSFGQITACVLLSNRAISPITSLMRYYRQSKDIKLIHRRLSEIASIEDQYDGSVPPFPDDIYGVIEVRDLPLKNEMEMDQYLMTRTFQAGSIIGIDPRDISGYKRLFEWIMGTERIRGQQIFIDNLDISEWNMNHLKGKIECLKDQVPLLKGSVLDNLTFFDETKISSAIEAAKLTGLDELINSMPEGYETVLDAYMASYLSSAFLQRLSLARAFLERPRILMIDRIDESMDDETLDIFKWLLTKLKGEVTIFLVTWNASLLALADERLQSDLATYVMRGGLTCE